MIVNARYVGLFALNDKINEETLKLVSVNAQYVGLFALNISSSDGIISDIELVNAQYVGLFALNPMS